MEPASKGRTVTVGCNLNMGNYILVLGHIHRGIQTGIIRRILLFMCSFVSLYGLNNRLNGFVTSFRIKIRQEQMHSVYVFVHMYMYVWK